MDTIIMVLKFHKNKQRKEEIDYDIEVPIDITANDLVLALNQGFGLGIDTNNVLECYLKTENPIALVKGDKTLRQFGLYDGTIINIT